MAVILPPSDFYYFFTKFFIDIKSKWCYTVHVDNFREVAMDWLWWCLGIFAVLVLNFFAMAFVCFRLTFYSKDRKPLGPDEYDTPDGEEYEPYRGKIINWTKQIRNMPHEDMSITSFDGLTLRAKYFECDPNAPIELLFNGYRGNAERDLSGGVERCFRLGRNVMIINQRASGPSDGNIISFGVNESRDCHDWVEYAIKRFGDDVKLIIGGVSMGASTVVIAAGKPLPKNVIGVLADCGYSSAKEIILKVMKEDLNLPPKIFYPVIKLGAKLFGGFNVENASPIDAVKNCTLPIVFVHGDSDNFVPPDMTRRVYEACPSEKKKLITIKGAGHGLAFPVDEDGYVEELKAVRDAWNLK